MSGPPFDSPAPGRSARFTTTHWSIVLAAGHRSSPDIDVALESLCRAYWYPLYAYARRRGNSADDAADLTQEFFARLIAKDFLQSADRDKGRFRTFLLTIFQRFLAKTYERQRAAKRGGDRQFLSIDVDNGDQRYAFEPADVVTPESLYDRRWALTLLDRAVERLREEYSDKNKGDLFEHCRVYLAGAAAGPGYARTAAALGMSEVAVRVTVHRMRDRYRHLVREEVAGTVASPDDVEDELRTLQLAIRGKKR